MSTELLHLMRPARLETFRDGIIDTVYEDGERARGTAWRAPSCKLSKIKDLLGSLVPGFTPGRPNPARHAPLTLARNVWQCKNIQLLRSLSAV